MSEILSDHTRLLDEFCEPKASYERVRAAVRALRAEVARLTVERDGYLDQVVRVIGERDTLSAEVARLQAALAESDQIRGLYLRTLKMLGQQLGETREASA